METELAVPFAIILGVAALAVAAYAGVLYLEMEAAKQWKPAPGEIVGSRMDSRVVKLQRPSGQSIFDDTRPTRTDYRACVKYRYEAAGQDYTGERVTLSPSRWTVLEPTQAAILAKYPLGKTVRVLYNPRKPEQAVLERTHERGAFGWMITAGVLAAMAVVMLVFFR